MGQNRNVSVIGGDARLITAAKRFAARGFSVRTFGLTADGTEQSDSLAAAAQAEILVCGLPFSRDGETVFAPLADKKIPINDLCGRLNGGQTLFAGMPEGAALRTLQAAGVSIIDYYKDETLTRINAALTAEALIGMLITALPCALDSGRIAIGGFGRIGSALAEKLIPLGADATVFARGEAARARAEAMGVKALPFSALYDRCGSYRALVNTVPAPVIGQDALANLPKDCLLIEAASAPYGIDAAAARERGFSYLPAFGLPGKFSPETAGEAIADTVIRLFREVKNNGTP